MAEKTYRGIIGGYLSQFLDLKRSMPAWPSFLAAIIASFVLFFILPLDLSFTRGGSSFALAETTSYTPSAVERCRWQKDRAFFADLESKNGPHPSSTDCDVSVVEHPSSPQVRVEVTPAPFLGVQPAGPSLTTARFPSLSSENDLSREIEQIVAGYPIEKMAPAIAQSEREIAALIIGIAKIESNWGRRVPRSADGADCFNYWGYKGAGTRGTAMGHGCFGTPEEGVEVVAKRLEELVLERHSSEPANLIVWKCGSSCASHSPESVNRWIGSVRLYYERLKQSS